LLGLVASAINQSEFFRHTFLGPMASTYGYWVIFGSIVSLKSKTHIKAALNCFLFFALMNTAFYCFEWMVTGAFLTRYLLRWLGMTALTPIGGYLVYFAKEKKRISVIAAALPSLFLISEGIMILINLTNDRVVQIDGIAELVPASAWYIANDILTAMVYFAFTAYLLTVFRKRGE
jgi:phosphate starvation-inducible membrane PsiE